MPTASTARSASMTLPGPMGKPAARSVRAKNIRFSTRRPWKAGVSLAVMGAHSCPSLGGGDLGLHLVKQRGSLAAADLRDIVLVFQQHADGVIDRLGIEGDTIELDQRFRPV